MFEIKGTYASAVGCFDKIEDGVRAQLQRICDSEGAAGSKIVAMPEVRIGGEGLTGFAMSIGKRIMPALVGSDIGCGVSYIYICDRQVDLQRLEEVIRKEIPAGFQVRKWRHPSSADFDFCSLLCRKHINEEKAALSLGTLGGDNHFLELDRDRDGNLYLFTHCGSRSLGKEVTAFYLEEGQRQLKRQGVRCPYELTWLEGELMADYIHDLEQAQGFAMLNREIILAEVRKAMGWKELSFGQCMHNFIDTNGILRRGTAVAYEGDEIIIPVSREDGVILGEGKGNPDWLFSAPHGGKHILNGRKEALQRTVEETKILKPVYSFKAGV